MSVIPIHTVPRSATVHTPNQFIEFRKQRNASGLSTDKYLTYHPLILHFYFRSKQNAQNTVDKQFAADQFHSKYTLSLRKKSL